MRGNADVGINGQTDKRRYEETIASVDVSDGKPCTRYLIKTPVKDHNVILDSGTVSSKGVENRDAMNFSTVGPPKLVLSFIIEMHVRD